jgi:septation ring formation regulator EzrA
VTNAALLAKSYFEGPASRSELTERFPTVFDRSQLEAAAYRRRLRDLGRIAQMLRSCEQRRDRALNNLYLLRKDEAQRSREAKQSLPNMQTSKSQADVEIMPPAGN